MNEKRQQMDYIENNGYFMSVDEDGVPDHVYIGLIADDGSGPLDEIKTKRKTKKSEDFNHDPHKVSDIFEGMVGLIGDKCAYCERAYTRSMSRSDNTVSLSVVHQCKSRSFDVSWTVTAHTDDIIDNFSDIIPF